MTLTPIPGGVCAAQGFRANGVLCGIKPSRKTPDLALIVSDTAASAAAVYTKNLVKGAPLLVTKEHLRSGTARAVIANSGNANTCNADGIAVAEAMCLLVEQHAQIPAGEVVVASTGVIGQPLPLARVEAGMAALAAGLSREGGSPAAQAIMTTDTFAKEAAVEFTLGGRACRLGGMAKGSGMIHVNMATMLAFVTTDAAVSPGILEELLTECSAATLNMVSVDGDTSTNDMCCVLANGMAGNAPVTGPGDDLDSLRAALTQVLAELAKMLARDGEGASKLLACRVTGASSLADARLAAKGVISSSLFKAAMFGADANWGRVLCALGYCGARIDPSKVSVSFSSSAGELHVCANGAGIAFSEELAARILAEDEIVIAVGLGDGTAMATAWGCDLTYDYVKINGDYRT